MTGLTLCTNFSVLYTW